MELIMLSFIIAIATISLSELHEVSCNSLLYPLYFNSQFYITY